MSEMERNHETSPGLYRCGYLNDGNSYETPRPESLATDLPDQDTGEGQSLADFLASDRVARERSAEIQALIRDCTRLSDFIAPISAEDRMRIEEYVNMRQQNPRGAAEAFPVIEQHRRDAIVERHEREMRYGR